MLVDLNRFKTSTTRSAIAGATCCCRRGSPHAGAARRLGEVGRIGGDEFVVVVRDPERAVLMADLILDELHRGFEIEGELMDVDASVGIAVSPDHGDGFDSLMQHADVAMYAAKDSGVAGSAMTPTPTQHAGAAHARGRSPSRRRLRGVRASLSADCRPRRECDPRGRGAGPLAAPNARAARPDAFMAVAEETGLVRAITSIVLRDAIGQASRWQEQGLNVHVSVNVSARCVLDEHLIVEVRELLVAAGLPGDRLTIELTESGVLHDPARARRVLSGLAAIQVGLSLDDFGTGHSSLAHLQQLPLTEVKIDRSFVRDVATSGATPPSSGPAFSSPRHWGSAPWPKASRTPQPWPRCGRSAPRLCRAGISAAPSPPPRPPPGSRWQPRRWRPRPSRRRVVFRPSPPCPPGCQLLRRERGGLTGHSHEPPGRAAALDRRRMRRRRGSVSSSARQSTPAPITERLTSSPTESADPVVTSDGSPGS